MDKYVADDPRLDDSDEDEDEDFPPGPSPVEVRQALADAGNFEALIAVLVETPNSLLMHSDVYAQLSRAMQVASAADPAGFTDRMFGALTANVGYLALRGQIAVDRLTRRADDYSRGQSSHWVPPELTQTVFTHLMRLQAHLADLMLARASAARKWGLVGRRAEADDREPDRRRPRVRVERPGRLGG